LQVEGVSKGYDGAYTGDEMTTLGTVLFNKLRTGSFKLFKRPFPGFLTILTL